MSSDRPASTLLLVVMGEWWSGHHPAPVIIMERICKSDCAQQATAAVGCTYTCIKTHWCVFTVILCALGELEETMHVIFKAGWNLTRIQHTH